jgi:hypothetical protein
MRPWSAALLVALARHGPGLLTQGARWGGKVRSNVDLGALAVPAGWRPAGLDLELENTT